MSAIRNDQVSGVSFLLAQTQSASARVTGRLALDPEDAEFRDPEKRLREKEHAEWLARQPSDAVVISNAPADAGVSKNVEHYREQAKAMRAAIVRLSNGQEERSIPAQLLGMQDTGDALANSVLQKIHKIPAHVLGLSVAFERGMIDTGHGLDAVSARGKKLTGIFTGDGADAVSLSGDEVRRVYTDADPSVVTTISGGNGAYVKAHMNTYSNADSLSVSARRVLEVSTGGGDDAIAIQARQAHQIQAGDGHDAISLRAGYASQIDGGNGNDAIAVEAVVASGISGGAGDDAISVVAASGDLSRPYAGYEWQMMNRGGGLPPTAAERLAFAAVHLTGADGGAGNDRMYIKTAGSFAISGGAGDDSITIDGGTVALDYSAPGQGHDTVDLAAGAMVMLKTDGSAGYSVAREGDSMTVRFANGSAVTLRNLSQAAAIGAGPGGAADEVGMLYRNAPLDRVV